MLLCLHLARCSRKFMVPIFLLGFCCHYSTVINIRMAAERPKSVLTSVQFILRNEVILTEWDWWVLDHFIDILGWTFGFRVTVKWNLVWCSWTLCLQKLLKILIERLWLLQVMMYCFHQMLITSVSFQLSFIISFHLSSHSLSFFFLFFKILPIWME